MESDHNDQRVALITGGTGGLGTAVIRAFLDRGSVVAVTYRRDVESENLRAAIPAAGDRLLPIRADLTNTEQVTQAVQQVVAAWGRIDYLANLVGGWAGGKNVWETTDADWDFLLSLNLRTVFACCRAVLPQMIAQDFGRIVNVSTRTAVQPSPGAAAYAVSKRGVITLTETLALEVRDHDITANCILPSVIDTPSNRQSSPGADFSRWVRPEQLAAIIVWLTSSEATPINGAAIPVYGRA